VTVGAVLLHHVAQEGSEDVRVAELDEARAFCVAREPALKADGPHLVAGALTGTHESSI